MGACWQASPRHLIPTVCIRYVCVAAGYRLGADWWCVCVHRVPYIDFTFKGGVEELSFSGGGGGVRVRGLRVNKSEHFWGE